MLLKYSFDDGENAQRIELAVDQALAAGFRTADILSAGTKLVSTEEMSTAILNAL